MVAQLPWLWLLGAGVALVVGIIAFIVAGGLVDHRMREPHPGQGSARSAGVSRGVRRAS
jgi:hypothetical protein